MTHIISGVVNVQDAHRVDVVVDYSNGVSVFIGENDFFTIEAMSQEPPKKMVLQSRNEILCKLPQQIGCYEDKNKTLVAGSQECS